MTTDNLLAVISEARRNKYSLVPCLSEDDVMNIWETTCKFVQKHLLQLKGVTIPGLGFFTFSQIKLNIGRDKVIVIQRPIFVLSECFIRKHNLTFNKQYVTGRVPLLPLNYTMLSNETLFNRDSIELCIKEIILAVSRCISSKGSVQLDFNEIGRLSIKNAKAKTKFFRDFIKKLDCCGELENAFRLHTAQSEMAIMTDPIPSRLSTSSSLALPRITESVCNEVHDASLRPVTDDQVRTNAKINHDGAIRDNLDVAKESFTESNPDHYRQFIPKTASLVSSRDGCSNAEYTEATNDNKPPKNVLPSFLENMVGKELCYLCHQRDQRSMYVDVSAEKREKEQYYEKILQEYKDRKNYLWALKECQAKRISQMHKEDTSSFNLDMVKRKAALKSMKSDEIKPSHVFLQRAITPPKVLKCMKYLSELDNQVMKSQEHFKEMKKRTEKVDRNEQNQLAKRLPSCQFYIINDNCE